MSSSLEGEYSRVIQNIDCLVGETEQTLAKLRSANSEKAKGSKGFNRHTPSVALVAA